MVKPRRQYRPGARGNPQLRGTGKMSENRVAWLKTALGQLVIMKYDNKPTEEEIEDDDTGEGGPTIRLYVPQPGRRAFTLNITAMTHDELIAMRKFFTMLFDMAEPVVIQRDEEAHNAFQNGDDSFVRIYREVPQFVVRERLQSEDREGLRDGSDDLPGGDGTRDSVDGDGLRAGGDALASVESADGGVEDDGTQTH